MLMIVIISVPDCVMCMPALAARWLKSYNIINDMKFPIQKREFHWYLKYVSIFFYNSICRETVTQLQHSNSKTVKPIVFADLLQSLWMYTTNSIMLPNSQSLSFNDFIQAAQQEKHSTKWTLLTTWTSIKSCLFFACLYVNLLFVKMKLKCGTERTQNAFCAHKFHFYAPTNRSIQKALQLHQLASQKGFA